ncbi:uncharacterized protein V1510DRAFT_422436 [Dipodascopsis tothii]|uniref:uncharacterized protein n=1 Tax=Dipodascopsis tothii TaxID=44089 RepID=UPI0034CE6D4C
MGPYLHSVHTINGLPTAAPQAHVIELSVGYYGAHDGSHAHRGSVVHMPGVTNGVSGPAAGMVHHIKDSNKKHEVQSYDTGYAREHPKHYSFDKWTYGRHQDTAGDVHRMDRPVSRVRSPNAVRFRDEERETRELLPESIYMSSSMSSSSTKAISVTNIDQLRAAIIQKMPKIHANFEFKKPISEVVQRIASSSLFPDRKFVMLSQSSRVKYWWSGSSEPSRQGYIRFTISGREQWFKYWLMDRHLHYVVTIDHHPDFNSVGGSLGALIKRDGPRVMLEFGEPSSRDQRWY